MSINEDGTLNLICRKEGVLIHCKPRHALKVACLLFCFEAYAKCGPALVSFQGKNTQRLYSLLNEASPPTREQLAKWQSLDEKAKELNWRDLLQRMQNKSLTPDEITMLEAMDRERLQFSNTVFNSSNPAATLYKWKMADQTIRNWIAEGKEPTRELLVQLNNLVTGERNSAPRTENLGTRGDFSSVDGVDASAALDEFVGWYQENKGKMHPIQLAAMAQQRLLTLHVFDDGNGRTCRLVSDWILQANGYPPATLFDDPAKRQLGVRHPLSTKDVSAESFTNYITESLEKTFDTVGKDVPTPREVLLAARKDNHVRKTEEGYTVFVPAYDDRVTPMTMSDPRAANYLTSLIAKPFDASRALTEAHSQRATVQSAAEKTPFAIKSTIKDVSPEKPEDLIPLTFHNTDSTFVPNYSASNTLERTFDGPISSKDIFATYKEAGIKAQPIGSDFDFNTGYYSVRVALKDAKGNSYNEVLRFTHPGLQKLAAWYRKHEQKNPPSQEFLFYKENFERGLKQYPSNYYSFDSKTGSIKIPAMPFSRSSPEFLEGAPTRADFDKDSIDPPLN